jgi:hypothetical protein
MLDHQTDFIGVATDSDSEERTWILCALSERGEQLGKAIPVRVVPGSRGTVGPDIVKPNALTVAFKS